MRYKENINEELHQCNELM